MGRFECCSRPCWPPKERKRSGAAGVLSGRVSLAAFIAVAKRSPRRSVVRWHPGFSPCASESTGRVAIPCRGHFREEGILPEPKSERPGSARESVVGRNGPRELLVLAQPQEPPQGSGDRMIDLRRAHGVGTYATARAGDEDRIVVFQ
jgi:hypothetical protein